MRSERIVSPRAALVWALVAVEDMVEECEVASEAAVALAVAVASATVGVEDLAAPLLAAATEVPDLMLLLWLQTLSRTTLPEELREARRSTFAM